MDSEPELGEPEPAQFRDEIERLQRKIDRMHAFLEADGRLRDYAAWQDYCYPNDYID